MSTRCFFCKMPQTLTLEHIIPQSIGGRLKEKLYCKAYNDTLGHTLDDEISKQFGWISTLLNIKRERGTSQPYEVKDLKSGATLVFDGKGLHFGVSGQPDAWSDKETFIKIYLLVVTFIAVLFTGIGLILRKIPASLINLPNKDYWLSPRAQAGHHRSPVSFGSATLLLLLDIFHQSFRVHLGKAQALEHPVASIAAYVGFSVLWSIGLIAKFMRRP